MFVEMICTCGASLQMEQNENETALWLLSSRCVEAHTDCGFVSGINKDRPEETTKYNINFKPRAKRYHLDDPDEDEDD